MDYFSKVPEIPYGFPPIEELAEELNVSTTTVLKIIEVLCKKGVARKNGSNKILLRKPKASDYFSSGELENSKVDLVEKEILRRISTYEFKPGDRFSELKLSKSLNSNTVVVHEALLKIAQSGLIKKHPRQKWEVVKFSSEMIEEIMAIRELYEGFSIQVIRNLPDADSIWGSFRKLKNIHLKLLKNKNICLEDLISIELSFHNAIIGACQNRFIQESYNSIFTLV